MSGFAASVALMAWNCEAGTLHCVVPESMMDCGMLPWLTSPPCCAPLISRKVTATSQYPKLAELITGT
jgi:hypothetical protein